MDEKIMKFLRKNNIHISNIKYLLRQENKTCIYMTDGRVVKTFITVKDLYEILIPYDYISINKGTVVSRGQIDHIENCTYHMKDGFICYRISFVRNWILHSRFPPNILSINIRI